MESQDRFKIIICGNERDERGIVLTIRDIIIESKDNPKTKINPKLINIANTFLKPINSHNLITNFIEKSNDYWDQIIIHDENFFTEHCQDIFYGLPENHIKDFQQLFKDNVIEDEDKDILWEYFKSLVKISIHYIHEQRQPKLVDGKPAYSKDFFPLIKLKQISKKWGVKLIWA